MMLGTRVRHVKQVETFNYMPGGFHPVHLGDEFKKNRYRVIHKLGHGGFATVWLARDVVRNRYVALKILAARLSRDCPEVEILRRLKLGSEHDGKAYVMSLLDHFWITGANGKHLCIVSEVAGPSIKQFNDCPGQATGSRRLRAVVARKVALQVTEGLSYIHSTGTVHGDFTTANILLQLTNIDEWTEEEIYERLGKPQCTKQHSSSKHASQSSPDYTVHTISMKEVDPQWLSNSIMIIDFGIAFLQEASSTDIGTPKSYCAPEFLFNDPRSISSDVWALGCTIFEIRTGSRLFRYKSSRPTRTRMLQTMVKILGTLPEKWWVGWDEGPEWCATQIEIGGNLADLIQGTLYNKIIDVGIHDGDYPATASSQGDESLGHDPGDDSGKGTTSRMVAMVGELTTSEAEDVLAEANGPIEIAKFDPGSGNSDNKNETSSGSGDKATSASSNAKSGEKSLSSEAISSEGIPTGKAAEPAAGVSKENVAERVEKLNLVGEGSLSRLPLASMKELPETGEVTEFLEPAGTRVTVVEAAGLENLLRRALMFLPEQRLGPSELAKHHWFVDDFRG